MHVLYEVDAKTVGMGRILGDGGWYFHVVDMAVLPEHQRRGLGDVVHRSRNSNAAKAAVGRKILIAAWHMLSRNEPFNPAPRRTSDTFVPASSRFALAA